MGGIWIEVWICQIGVKVILSNILLRANLCDHAMLEVILN